VSLPASASIGLLLAGFAASLWFVSPASGLVALMIACPYKLAFNFLELKGIRLQDVIMQALLVSLVVTLLAGKARLRLPAGLGPRLVVGMWIFLAIWQAVAFLEGPANQGLVGDPLRDTWYLYRQIWSPMLPFPIFAACLLMRPRSHRLITALVAGTAGLALYAMLIAPETGDRAVGPFSHPNGLASFLILVIPFALARFFRSEDSRRRLLYGGMLLILLRALWLTGSRGGFVACLASLVPFTLMISRRRLLSLAIAGLLMVLVVITAKSDILERPNVRRYLTLSQPEEVQTFQWRQEQWMIFLERIRDRPWLGMGSGIDENLLARGRLGTAHNLYLSLAVQYGIPSAVVVIALLATLLALSLKNALHEPDVSKRAFWEGMVGFLVAVSVHGVVEAALVGPQLQHLFWMLAAISVSLGTLAPSGRKVREEEMRLVTKVRAGTGG
jgi:O-antigen ligase